MSQSATTPGKPATRQRAYRLLGLALILLTLALALPAGAGADIPAGDGWNAQSSGSSARLTGVAFPDATHGWAVGEGGAILATTDGGATWSIQSPANITKLKPASGKRGATVTISGTNFGEAQDAGAVKFGAKTCAKYVSWNDTQIKCKVPAKAKYGKVNVTVTTAAGKSNAMSFTVKR